MKVCSIYLIISLFSLGPVLSSAQRCKHGTCIACEMFGYPFKCVYESQFCTFDSDRDYQTSKNKCMTIVSVNPKTITQKTSLLTIDVKYADELSHEFPTRYVDNLRVTINIGESNNCSDIKWVTSFQVQCKPVIKEPGDFKVTIHFELFDGSTLRSDLGYLQAESPNELSVNPKPTTKSSTTPSTDTSEITITATTTKTTTATTTTTTTATTTATTTTTTTPTTTATTTATTATTTAATTAATTTTTTTTTKPPQESTTVAVTTTAKPDTLTATAATSGVTTSAPPETRTSQSSTDLKSPAPETSSDNSKSSDPGSLAQVPINIGLLSLIGILFLGLAIIVGLSVMPKKQIVIIKRGSSSGKPNSETRQAARSSPKAEPKPRARSSQKRRPAPKSEFMNFDSKSDSHREPNIRPTTKSQMSGSPAISAFFKR